MDEESLSSKDIQEKYISDIKSALESSNKHLSFLRQLIGQDELDNIEIIWEFSNTVLFVFPIGEDIYSGDLELLGKSTLVSFPPHVTLYNGRLAVRVVLVESYKSKNTQRTN